MKINFDLKLTDINGKTIDDALLNKAIANAVMDDNKEGLSFDEKEYRYNLAKRINSGGDIELTPEDIIYIKEVASKKLTNLAIGPLAKIFGQL